MLPLCWRFLNNVQISTYELNNKATPTMHKQNTKMGHRKWVYIFKNKNKMIHFWKLSKLHNDPCLKLNESEISVLEQHKFLSLIFDRKLTFIPHLKYLKIKWSKILQIYRGANRNTLIKLYRSLLRSKWIMLNFIYGATRKSYTKILDATYRQGLRLGFGVFRTFPVESRYTEAGETSPRLRHVKLALYSTM